MDREQGRAAEAKAVREVNAREPDRVNLRGLLDKVFACGDNAVDVQRVRRLVAALVNRGARHTKHGHQAPTLGVHACARGKGGSECSAASRLHLRVLICAKPCMTDIYLHI